MVKLTWYVPPFANLWLTLGEFGNVTETMGDPSLKFQTYLYTYPCGVVERSTK
jgi:hypothetical protein